MEMKDWKQLAEANKKTRIDREVVAGFIVDHLVNFCPDVLSGNPLLKTYVDEYKQLSIRYEQSLDELMDTLVGNAEAVSFKEATNGQP